MKHGIVDPQTLAHSEVSRTLMHGSNSTVLACMAILALIGVVAAIYVRIRHPELFRTDSPKDGGK